MVLSLKELKENLVDNIIKIGVDSKIKECTFLDSIIEEIMEVFNVNEINKNDNYIMCDIDKNISLNLNNDGVRSELIISNISDGLFYISIASIGPKNIKVYEKQIDLNNRIISTNQGICKHRDIDIETNNSTMVINKHYDEDGIMNKYEAIRFKPNSIVSGINQNYKNVILHIPHSYKDSFFWQSNYMSKTTLDRVYLDVAKIEIDFKESGMFYSSMAQLSTEHGLRDMNLPDLYRSSLPKNFVISSITDEQIEELILTNKENVINGLRKYVKDRKSFNYNSSVDPNFKHEIRR